MSTTNEVRLYSGMQPEQYAELMFDMMAAFPANPLDQLLSPEQMQHLRAAYMPEATAKAERMRTEDGDIALRYTMQWAVATA